MLTFLVVYSKFKKISHFKALQIQNTDRGVSRNVNFNTHIARLKVLALPKKSKTINQV